MHDLLAYNHRDHSVLFAFARAHTSIPWLLWAWRDQAQTIHALYEQIQLVISPWSYSLGMLSAHQKHTHTHNTYITRTYISHAYIYIYIAHMLVSDHE